MHFDTKAVHAGLAEARRAGVVATPIHLSTTFVRDSSGTSVTGHTYIRESSPTQSTLESSLAPLEGGEAALVFASGMAAGIALFQALDPGSHVVLPDDVYYGFRAAASEFLPRWGLTATLAAMDDASTFRAALRPDTRLVWVETPSNPLLKIVDIANTVNIARAAGATVVVDNTFATPALQQPLALGADVVMHATTKYFGGHSDVQGGALIFRERSQLFEKVERIQHLLGSVPSPFNSWLVLRGIRTLPLRVRAQCETAGHVARMLASHASVQAVHYPGLPSHPGHAVAARQMSAFGAMLSFQVRGGESAAVGVVGRTELFTRATSLGSVESLIEHRASSEGPSSTTPRDLIRLSIGLEHPDDLIADLSQALASSAR